MKIFFSYCLFFCALLTFGQTKDNFVLIDAKMAKIPKASTKNTKSIADYIATNFKSENEKLRAAFFWVASILVMMWPIWRISNLATLRNRKLRKH